MSISYVTRTEIIPTALAAAVDGAPFKVDGNAFDFQILLAPANFTIQVSQDCINWVNGTDIDAGALTALGAGVYLIARERPVWVQAQIAADAGGPSNGIWVIGVMKET